MNHLWSKPKPLLLWRFITMSESTMSVSVRQGRNSPHASLAVLGCHLRQLDLFAPIRQLVHIPQKTVRYSPTDKLFDGFVALLAVAHGLVEINSRLRADPALQAAFATKGYFARQRNRRGRQLGRVVASHYTEIVVDRLFPGNTQLNTALPD